MTATLVATADSIETLVSEELAGEFRVIEPLGWGRWGMRFRAEDLHRAEEVILTALPALDPADPAEGERFLEALRAASLLDHPHLIPICGYGVGGPLRWFAIPPIDDATLAARLAAGGALPLPEVRRIAQQLASALEQAHRRGIAHGALTANEILIDQAGWVRIREIGIAAGVDRKRAGHARLIHLAQGADQVEFARILHACLTGGSSTVPLPTEIPVEVERALRRGTHPRAAERFRDLLDLVSAIDAPAESAPSLQSATSPPKRGGPNAWDAFLDREELEPPPHPIMQWGARAILALIGTLVVVAAFAVGRPLLTPEDQGATSVLAEEAPLAPAPPPAIVTEEATAPPAAAPKSAVVPAPKRRPRPTVHPAAEEAVVLIPPVSTSVPSFGTLSVSSFPWGELSVDGQVVGNTPQSGILLKPGKHTLRITRDGYQAFETTFDLPAGRTLRLTQVPLKELTL